MEVDFLLNNPNKLRQLCQIESIKTLVSEWRHQANESWTVGICGQNVLQVIFEFLDGNFIFALRRVHRTWNQQFRHITNLHFDTTINHPIKADTFVNLKRIRFRLYKNPGGSLCRPLLSYLTDIQTLRLLQLTERNGIYPLDFVREYSAPLANVELVDWVSQDSIILFLHRILGILLKIGRYNSLRGLPRIL